jgi:hypothetical protein
MLVFVPLFPYLYYDTPFLVGDNAVVSLFPIFTMTRHFMLGIMRVLAGTAQDHLPSLSLGNWRKLT